MTLIDTGAVFDFLAGGDAADKVARLLERGEASLSAISVFELYAGVTNKRHVAEREEFVQLCEVVGISATIARRAAAIYTNLRAAGQLMANEDLLIAATCLETGCSLLTLNSGHFARVSGLVLAPTDAGSG